MLLISQFIIMIIIGLPRGAHFAHFTSCFLTTVIHPDSLYNYNLLSSVSSTNISHYKMSKVFSILTGSLWWEPKRN